MTSTNIVTLTDANFEEEVLRSQVPVLVDFWAGWCGPCRMLGPLIEELAGEYDGRVKVGKINIDDATKVSDQYGIRAIPTVLVFKGRDVVDQIVGLKSRRDYKASLDRVLE
jgi:thioredoxin 1